MGKIQIFLVNFKISILTQNIYKVMIWFISFFIFFLTKKKKKKEEEEEEGEKSLDAKSLIDLFTLSI